MPASYVLILVFLIIFFALWLGLVVHPLFLLLLVVVVLLLAADRRGGPRAPYHY